jgi:hypothetical protein
MQKVYTQIRDENLEKIMIELKGITEERVEDVKELKQDGTVRRRENKFLIGILKLEVWHNVFFSNYICVQ